MVNLPPLRFRPILRRYIWGGRRLETVLGKQLGPGNDYAESWEICDHGSDQSTVEAGPLAGATLAQLVSQRGEELLGRHHPQGRDPQRHRSAVRMPLSSALQLRRGGLFRQDAGA